jgi:hypothetical protein
MRLSAVASSTPDTSESGFATPAAAAISLAVAVMATALTAAGVAELRQAHADLSRTQADYALAGVQTRAVLSVLMAKTTSPLRWSPTGAAEALAEPEAAKLGLEDAAQLDDASLARFGVTDAAQLRTRLAGLVQADAAEITTADAAPGWRACARSMISPYGTAPKLQLAKASRPAGASVQWRLGDVWRIRIVLANGWVDDRIVRFTGNMAHPAAVVERRLMRGQQEGDRCETLFAAG